MRPHPALFPLALAALIAACGGGEDSQVVSTDREPPTATLLDDEGQAMAPASAAEPADAGARTRQGRYATAAQAADLERALGDRLLRVQVECCGADGLERSIGLAHGLQAAHDLPDSTPVLVQGADLRLAAVAANRMAEAGHANVWLVTR